MLVFLAQGISGAARLGEGLKQAASETNLESGSFPTLIGTVIGSMLTVIGILFFLLSVYGGFLWMTARGNEEEITKGKNTIIAAVIGVIIVIGSYAVTNLVLQSTSPQPAGQGTPQQGSVAGQCIPRYNSICSGTSEGVCASAQGCAWIGECVAEEARDCDLFNNDVEGCRRNGFCEFRTE